VVQVKMQLTICSGSSELRSITSRTSSSVADRIASGSFASTVMAPLSARSFMRRRFWQPTDSTEDESAPGGGESRRFWLRLPTTWAARRPPRCSSSTPAGLPHAPQALDLGLREPAALAGLEPA
jgi:hypothetical protein